MPLACVYVFSDHILSQQVPGPSPIRVCSYVGAYCTVLSVIWIMVYTVPRFDELIHVNPDVPMQSVAGMYALLIVASATHAWNYYELIGRTGNVSNAGKSSSYSKLHLLFNLFLYCPFLGCHWHSTGSTSHSRVWAEPLLVLQQ